MGIVAKAELDYNENDGVKISSTCEDDQTEWEFILAGMLLEVVAVRHGWTTEETAEALVGSIKESGGSTMHITREAFTDADTDEA